MKGELSYEGVLRHLDVGVGAWALDHPSLGRVQLNFRPGAAPGRALDGARVVVRGALSDALMGVAMATARTLTVESLRPLP
ncbi:MAG: hypothetical protein JNM72_16845 [Deltaproteobacteria bacterium]|nr:hypothetical protein [Deltaproteobacteria bacterium]